ncbi:hypothetical protein WJX75_003303 [Coccomyxa subellipsoidea]|uniref:G domain-containing protein n=1 Tax=Coccomyxa subellipsoidea TaxID=248742 RepID=A0ABR2YT33_9CHLO
MSVLRPGLVGYLKPDAAGPACNPDAMLNRVNKFFQAKTGSDERAQRAASLLTEFFEEGFAGKVVDKRRRLRAWHRDFGSHVTAEYERDAHLQLVLGIPGLGKSTLINNLGPLVLDRLDREPEWLRERTGFRECLRSSLEADIPYTFVLDLKVHVDEAWGRENYMLDQLCLAPSRTLALLLLLALALRSKKQISDLLDLVQQLPEELLAIIRPEHVVRWIHDNIPRSKQQTDSFVIFALDEASSLRQQARRHVRGALARVVHTKKLLPMEACLTVIAASTRWGRTGGRVDRSLVSGTTGLQQIGSSARSDVGSKARAAGASGGSNLQQTFDQAQRTPMAHPAVPEGQLQDMPSAAVPGVEGDCDDESTDLALQMTPSGTTSVQSVYLGILSRDNRQKLFLGALEMLGLEAEELPTHEPDTFFKGALNSGLRFHEDQPHRLKEVYDKLGVFEHQEVVPELSKGQMRPLTFSQLQAYGLLSLQPVSGEGTMYRVTMSAASLDGYLTSVDGGSLTTIYRNLQALLCEFGTNNYASKEVLDLQSWLLLLETARALSGPSQSMAGQTTIREILCLPETVTGRAFDLELRLDDLDLTPRGQSKKAAATSRKPPADRGMELIIEEHAKMFGKGTESAFLLLVSDQDLPAHHGLDNVAVLSNGKHQLYSPAVRLLRLLEDVQLVCLGGKVLSSPGESVKQQTRERNADSKEVKRETQAAKKRASRAEDKVKPSEKGSTKRKRKSDTGGTMSARPLRIPSDVIKQIFYAASFNFLLVVI